MATCQHRKPELLDSSGFFMPSTILHPESLYLEDETAWLDMTAQLVAEGRFDELDRENLQEFLLGMARRDRREVFSRLVVLLAHLLKWDLQPELRSKSWELTIFQQRAELRDLLASRTLENHAHDELKAAYARAIKEASIETGLPLSQFPDSCPWTLNVLLNAA